MDFFWAEIVDVEKDDEKSGRAKIRIFEDQSRLKDDELRYARPIFPVTSTSVKGAGSTPGYQKGSRVLGFFLDNDKQIPYILGTIPSAGKPGSLSQEGRDIPTGIAKDPGKFNIKTEDFRYVTSGSLEDRKIDNKGITQFAKAEANGPSKFGDVKTIGTKIPFGKNATDVIKKIDPKNSAGVLGAGVLSMLKAFQSAPAAKLITMVVAANFNSVKTQIASNNKQSTNNDLINRLMALLDLVNNVLIIIGKVSPQDATTFRKNVSQINEATNNLSNSSYYQEQCNIIVNLGNTLSITPNDKLLELVAIIITECQRLKNSINQQIQSLKS
jgi:Gp5 N-terminal OB domain